MSQEIRRIDLNGVNAYLLKEENNNFALIDTGGYLMVDAMQGGLDNRRTLLQDYMVSEGCTKENLKIILLTHADSDHVMNAAFLSKEFDAPIAIHEADAEQVMNPSFDDAMKSFHYRRISMKLLTKIMKYMFIKVTKKTLSDYEAFTPEIRLQDGDSLSVYGIHARIIHLPGHTPGSIGIYTENKELIVGDTFICNKKPEPAINAWDFKSLSKSIEKVNKMDIHTIYPGHGNSFKL